MSMDNPSKPLLDKKDDRKEEHDSSSGSYKPPTHLIPSSKNPSSSSNNPPSPSPSSSNPSSPSSSNPSSPSSSIPPINPQPAAFTHSIPFSTSTIRKCLSESKLANVPLEPRLHIGGPMATREELKNFMKDLQRRRPRPIEIKMTEEANKEADTAAASGEANRIAAEEANPIAAEEAREGKRSQTCWSLVRDLPVVRSLFQGTENVAAENNSVAASTDNLEGNASSTAQAALKLRKERSERIKKMTEDLWVVSEDFYKKITKEHRKEIKEMMKDKSALEEKARILRKEADSILPSLFGYSILPSLFGYFTASAVTIFGAVSSAEILANDPGLGRGFSLIPFFYAIVRFKCHALDMLDNLRKDEVEQVQEKHRDLIHDMNCLRCKISSTKTNGITGEDSKDIIDEEGILHRGDKFEQDCKRILAPIGRSHMHFDRTRDVINVMYVLACFVFAVFAITFVLLIYRYFFPAQGPAPGGT